MTGSFLLALAACGSPVPVTMSSPGGSSGSRSGAGGGSNGAGGGGGIQLSVPSSSSGGGAQAVCGNALVEDTEKCDDANHEGGDGCSKLCQVENNFDCPTPGKPCINMAKCGNSTLTSDEVCDDGNTKDDDGCSADCKAIESGWQCRVPGKPCTSACGDGVLSGQEVCDDHNSKNGDGCSVTCRVEVGWKCDGVPSVCSKTTCGDGKKEGAESCDDSNTMPFDGCSAECQIEPDCSKGACTSKCGDGIMLAEACDDGNVASGDGCSKDCKIEDGWTCKQPELGDKMQVPAIFRDFKMHTPTDFEPNDDKGCAVDASNIQKCVGMVKADLDGEGKPVFTGLTSQGVNVSSADSFQKWFRTTANVNHPNASKLTLWKIASGAYVNRYGKNGEQWKTGVDGNPLFFPVDDDPFSSSELQSAQIPGFYDASVPTDLDASGKQRMHNFSFTSEVRYWFKYEAAKSYALDFVGDDDFWVFINRKLAVDLGGLHTATPGSVTLDAATASKLGNMKDGSVYEVAVFHAERHTTASSFKLTLSGFNPAATVCAPACGDGVAVAEEECDNGKDNSDAAYGGCTTKCKWGAFCGDGKVNKPQEDCDNGKDNGIQYGPEGCTFGCTRPHFCGDGRLDGDRGEECDDGEKNGVADGSGHISCSADCRAPIL